MNNALMVKDDQKALRPPLKWAGGKRWQVPYLRTLWVGNEHRRLVEPFCGGMSVTLGLDPSRAVLNDVNPHLMNFYRQLQRGLTVSIDMENVESLFYQHRDRFNALIRLRAHDTAEGASLFYFLNRTGFNGLCRFNSRGGFNVPFGRYKSINYTRDFDAYRERFSGWTFTNTDAVAVPLQFDDFVYADPPYDVEFTTYSQGGFGWKDQERTAERFTHHPGPVVLVNQATERIEALYRRFGYDVTFLDAPRRISCTGDRTPAKEILATRNV